MARGESVFPSADGRHLYIKQAETRLIELPATGSGPARHLALPRGWSLPSGLGGWAVAGGRAWPGAAARTGRHHGVLRRGRRG